MEPQDLVVVTFFEVLKILELIAEHGLLIHRNISIVVEETKALFSPRHVFANFSVLYPIALSLQRTNTKTKRN